MNKIRRFCRSVERSFRNNRGDIMIGIGIGLIPVAVISTGIATAKAIPQVEKRKKAHPEEHPVTATAKASAPYYIGPVIFTTASICFISAGLSDGYKREAAMATAYTLTKESYREFRDKVKEKLGEKVEAEINDDIARDHVNANPPREADVYISGPGEILCYDDLNGRYFHCKINSIEKAVNVLNRRMMSEMYVSLNEFYYEIGQPGTRNGDLVGWNIDNGYIELQYSYCGNDDGEPCLVIGFNVEPNERFCHLG